LAGAIDALRKGDLDMVDVMRLGRLLASVEKYCNMYVACVGYHEIEQKVYYAINWMKKVTKSARAWISSKTQKSRTVFNEQFHA
jgi:DNA-binding transcriptional regulator YbjK